MSDDFDALLDAAIERRTAEPVTETVDVLVGVEVWSLRFSEMDALEWANVIALNPQRPGSNIDRQFGYNYDGAAMTAAPLSGVRVDGETVLKLSESQWVKVFRAISGHDFEKLSNAVWGLNEIQPMRRLAEAKKASAVVPVKKRRSPAN